MKKLLMIALVGGAFAMTSCTKEHTCACTATASASNLSYTAEMKKKDAETWCDSWQTAGTAIPGWKCTLD